MTESFDAAGAAAWKSAVAVTAPSRPTGPRSVQSSGRCISTAHQAMRMTAEQDFFLKWQVLEATPPVDFRQISAADKIIRQLSLLLVT